MQGNGGVGGLGARDRGGEAVRVDGRLEDHDGNVDLLVSGVEEERPGQLEHRREVADADARVQHHRLLLHGSIRLTTRTATQLLAAHQHRPLLSGKLLGCLVVGHEYAVHTPQACSHWDQSTLVIVPTPTPNAVFLLRAPSIKINIPNDSKYK